MQSPIYRTLKKETCKENFDYGKIKYKNHVHAGRG